MRKSLKRGTWKGLELFLGGVWGGIWSLLGPLGSFWGFLFSHLYLEWSSKVLLEAPRLDFGSIFKGLGRILGGFGEGFGKAWEGFSSILGDSGLFWAILGYWAVFGCSSQDFCRCCLLLAAPQLEFEFKISSCFCLLLFAWA